MNLEVYSSHHFLCILSLGKGELKTFWLVLDASVDSHGGGSSEMDTSRTGDSVGAIYEEQEDGTFKTREELAREERYKRLIDWNVDMLTRLLRKLARQRKAGKVARNFDSLSLLPKPGSSTIDEVKEIIYLGGTSNANEKEPADLDPEAISQLRFYVTSICSMYRDNACKSRRRRLFQLSRDLVLTPFWHFLFTVHNFEHASRKFHSFYGTIVSLTELT